MTSTTNERWMSTFAVAALISAASVVQAAEKPSFLASTFGPDYLQSMSKSPNWDGDYAMVGPRCRNCGHSHRPGP